MYFERAAILQNLVCWRKEMKRIWVPINEFKFDQIEKIPVLNLRTKETESKMFFSLGVGNAFIVRDIAIYSEYFERGGKTILQTWQYAKARSLDAPIHHSRRKNKYRLFDTVLRKSVCDFLMKQRRQDTIEFIETGLDPFNEESKPLIFRPVDWPEKTKLRLPVDFVSIFSLEALNKNGPVVATVQIGHLLCFWKTEIYNPKEGIRLSSDSILYPKIVDVINHLLSSNDELINLVKGLSRVGGANHNLKEFTESTDGCNIFGTPPGIRFY